MTTANTDIEATIQALLDDGDDAAAIGLLREHGETVYVADDGNAENEIDAESAREAAEEYVAGGDWGDASKTSWVTVYVFTRLKLGGITLDLDDRDSFEVEVEPDEPSCPEGEHDWVTPYAVLGGLRENPGVQGHGGGVICHEVCRYCGCLRTTDTWAQNPETGKQGLTSVEYNDGDHSYRDAWSEWRAEEEEADAADLDAHP